MDKDIKKSLKVACLSPVNHIINILECKDSPRMKLAAIEHYCRKTKSVIEKTIKENL